MLKAAEAAHILRHAGVRALATDSGLAALAQAAAAQAGGVERLLWLPDEDGSPPVPGLLGFDALAACPDAPPPVALAGSDLAQIVYTSGTESLPKGAMLSHDAVLWQYVSCVVDASIAGDDLLLHALPLYHCAQLDVFFGPAVYVGASNVITGKPVAEHLLALIERHRINSFFAPLATMLGPEDQLRKPGSCGRPVLNVETRVVDEQMRDVAPGEVGEIVHRSPQLLVGYFHDDERTAAACEGGWFHSGDLATIDEEGYISVVDRKKDMIKTGGENVASREVEETIYRLAGVSEVAVVGVPHPHWVEAVVAVVVVKAGHALDEAAVLAHCAAQLAAFKRPKRVFFAQALPKNPSGKLLKRELRAAHARLFDAP